MYPISYSLSAAPYAISFVLLFGICLALMSLLYLRDSEQDTRLVRGYLRCRLQRLPLARLLRALNMAPERYARSAPIPLLQQQLRNCRRCARKASCRRALTSRRVAESELGFCPNLHTIPHLPAAS